MRVAAGLEKQMRFAATMALTKTAQDAQQEVMRQLPERFTIRTGFLKSGVRYRPADKNDRNMVSRVVDLDSFMALQETGGDKRQYSGKDMAVPIGARPTPLSTTPLSKWPSALLAKLGRGYFVAPLTGKAIATRSQAEKNAFRRRFGRDMTQWDVGKVALWKRRGQQRLPIDLIYLFEDVVHIKPRFGFCDTVKKVARQQLPIRLQEAINYIARTAR